MLRYSRTAATLLMCTALLAFSATAHAQSWRALFAQSNGGTQQTLVDPNRSNATDIQINRREAAAIAREAVAGRVLNVRLRGNVYEVKMLVAGERVRVVRVDARTGRVR